MTKMPSLLQWIFITLVSFCCTMSLTTQELSTVRILHSNDIKIFRLDPSKDGFDLFIRKKEGVESIMLTDSTVDLIGLYDNFALRAYDPDPTYANEPRNLNNRTIDLADGSYFLVTSTAKIFKELGNDPWFHLFVPTSVVYGYPYPGSREGQIDFIDDFWINIRTFSSVHASYDPTLDDRGFRDNPYHIRFQEKRPPSDEIASIRNLAVNTGGLFFSDLTEGSQFIDSLEQVFQDMPHQGLTKVVFAIDATVSMKYVMPYVQKHFLPSLIKIMSEKPILIGFVIYRDYEDLLKGAYLTKVLGEGFTDDPRLIEKHIASIKVGGGHDIPEAVYEAIERAVHDFNWNDATNRIIIQIGDAPAHPHPKTRKIRKDGKTITIIGPTQEETILIAQSKNIKIINFLLPTNVHYF
ncbi:hypothetical protein PVA44_02205 [Entomospira nematocerorum]|uniref:VWFA domain-containing protein n=1 Tax=Entomospira nematocerorum TaxID=2719987 RepID=A0A968GG27_9SPIO|nr:hypothetical protein [Entomospira nematocera]NIZ47156.1 hypothetical protein [Entomospira nematocera]WDI34301.1 hypothetical protein PVA44_02205 [Entomospira nematocera]